MAFFWNNDGSRGFFEEDWDENVTYRCPCCRYKTIHGRNHHDICPVCFWEDNGQDDHDADEVIGGPNNILSLTQARANFLKFGACEEDMIPNVRKPTLEEM